MLSNLLKMISMICGRDQIVVVQAILSSSLCEEAVEGQTIIGTTMPESLLVEQGTITKLLAAAVPLTVVVETPLPSNFLTRTKSTSGNVMMEAVTPC